MEGAIHTHGDIWRVMALKSDAGRPYLPLRMENRVHQTSRLTDCEKGGVAAGGQAHGPNIMQAGAAL
jgi:hypothetical protein